jgi:sulfate adenylyltransferase
MASTRTCPHPAEQRSVLSGTRVRELLAEGEPLPAEFTRPAIAELLRAAQAGEAAAVPSTAAGDAAPPSSPGT